MARAYLKGQVEARSGRAIKGASVRVYTDSSGQTLATLYAAKTGGSALTQPLTTDSDGEYEAFVSAPGTYWIVASASVGQARWADRPSRSVAAFTSEPERINAQLDPEDEETAGGLALHVAKTAAADDIHQTKTYTDAQVSAEATVRGTADSTHAGLTGLVGNPHGIQEYVATRVTKAVIDALGINASHLGGLTSAQLQTAVIAAIVDAAPGTLDTLNELSAALGDDPNFASTITTLVGTKAADNAVVKLTGDQTVAGVKTFNSVPLINALDEVMSTTGRYYNWRDGQDVTDRWNAVLAEASVREIIVGSHDAPADYLITSSGLLQRSDVVIRFLPGARLVVDGLSVYGLKPDAPGFTRLSNITIIDYNFLDPDPLNHVGVEQSHGIAAGDIDHLKIIRPRIEAAGDESIDLIRCFDAWVIDPTIIDYCAASVAGGAIGLNTSNSSGVIGGTFEGGQGSAVRVEITSVADIRDLWVVRTLIKDQTGDKAAVVLGNGADGDVRDLHILQNRFYDNAGAAVKLFPTGGGIAEGVEVVGNTVRGGGDSSDDPSGAFWWNTAAGTPLLKRNRVFDWGGVAGHVGYYPVAGAPAVLDRNFEDGVEYGIDTTSHRAISARGWLTADPSALATAVSLGTSPDQIGVWSCADGATQGVIGNWQVPEDAELGGPIRMSIVWNSSVNENGTAVDWSIVARAAAAGGTFVGSGTTTTFTGTTANKTTTGRIDTALTQILASANPGDWIHFGVRRLGIADTFTGAARIIGLVLEYDLAVA